MRILKIFLVTLVVLPVLAALALYGVLTSFDFEKNQTKIEEMILNETGYQVRFQKPEVTFFPAPLFTAENITVDAFYGDQPLFEANNILMQTTWKDFLFFKLGIKKLAVDNPSIYLRVNEYGYANWEKKRSKRKQKNTVDLSFIQAFGEVVISDAKILYENDFLGERFLLEEGALGLSGLNMANVSVDAHAIVNGQPLQTQGEINLSSGVVEPAFDVSIHVAEENALFLKGFLKNPLQAPHFEGSVSIKGPSLLTALYEILHFAPEQRGFDYPISLTTNAILSSQNIQFSALDLDLGFPDNKIKVLGTFDLNKGKKRDAISASLRFPEKVNPAHLGFCLPSETSVKSFSWPDERLDFSTVMSSDVVIDVLFEEGVLCGGLDIPHLQANLLIEDGKIQVKPLVIKEDEDDSSVAAELLIKGKRSYKGELAFSLSNAHPISWLKTSFNDRVQLPLSGENAYNFHGASLAEWVHSLEGQSTLSSDSISLGGLSGGSLVGIVRYILGETRLRPAGLTQKGTLQLSSETQKGVMRLKQASLDTRDLKLTAKGKMDLNRLAVNVHVFPKSSAVLDLSIPVLIKGKVSGLSIVPDPGALQNQAAAIGAVTGGPVGALVGAAIGNIISTDSQDKTTVNTEEEDEAVDPLLEFIRKKVNE